MSASPLALLLPRSPPAASISLWSPLQIFSLTNPASAPLARVGRPFRPRRFCKDCLKAYGNQKLFGELNSQKLKCMDSSGSDGCPGYFVENVDAMVQNMDRTQALDEASSALATQASMFQRTARDTRRHMWWQLCKQRLIIGGVAGVLLLALILWICGAAGAFDGDDDSPSPPSPPH